MIWILYNEYYNEMKLLCKLYLYLIFIIFYIKQYSINVNEKLFGKTFI